MTDYYAVFSVTGVHIGLWADEEVAKKIQAKEYSDGTIVHMREVPKRVEYGRINDPLQFSDLEFENGRLVKIRGLRPEYLGGFTLIDFIRQIAQIALRQRAPWSHRMFFPIVMPVNEHGQGPASEEKGEIRKLTWEVWDQHCSSYGSYDTLGEAVLKAEELNDKFGHCVDEGCDHYGTPHTHLKSFRETLPFRAEPAEHSDPDSGGKEDQGGS